MHTPMYHKDLKRQLKTATNGTEVRETQTENVCQQCIANTLQAHETSE